MNFNPSHFFKQFPELRDIANRLHESEVLARQKNEQNEKQATRQHVSEFAPAPKKPQKVYGDHAVISSYYKDRQWWATPNVPKEGEKAFIKSLENIVNTRNPDAIHVDIYKGKGGRNRDTDFSRDFYLTDNAEEIRQQASLPAPVELGSVIEQFDKKLDTLKVKDSDNVASIEIMRLGFERELDKIRFESEKKDLASKYESELKDLRMLVAQKEGEISDLKAELDEMDGELGGVDNKAPAWMDHPLMQQGAQLLSGLVQNWMQKAPAQPAIAGPGRPSQPAPAPTATLEETPAEKYPGLDPAHLEGIEKLSRFFASIPTEDFRHIYLVMARLQNPDGTLNQNQLQELTAFLSESQN